MSGKRIAVIGGGISGLGAAWLLSKEHHVTLFEYNDYVGGHTHTQEIPGPTGAVAVDTGFIVYNEPNYPLLTGLFRHLGVTTHGSDMSFAFRSADGRLEWAGDRLDKLFAQRRNIVSPSFLRMVRDIIRFNRRAHRYLDAPGADDLTLAQFLNDMRASRELREQYLLPMAAAIWSCPQAEMLRFPARRFLQFFRNHGLIDLANRPQWRTVTGGGREYVRRLVPEISGGCHAGTPVRRVTRRDDGVELHSDRELLGRFDEVVLATHADQALAMIDSPTADEHALLGAFGYQENVAWLHRDETVMPRLRRIWASWNYQGGSAGGPASVSYWMNRLQQLPTDENIFVTLNPETPPAPDRTHARMVYDHPVFDAGAVQAQGMFNRIQGRDRLWFCGSYLGYGFHEDGLRSGANVASAFGIDPPWIKAQADAPVAVAPPEAQPEWQTP
ncbi:FAD-dependent oxidoreductase [Aquisalimonas sp.]|uniref:NAD(P)/FAD-dependent oxidoreductase n=1 Tax=unclassified Aquisalimonas TaxID=2644645 RepID=UPI0025C5B0F1|nr:FAD-dependent oxidoreductase [Aquisalimonas sp.]